MIKKIIINIIIIILNFIYCFFKLIPTKNKITFISRQANSTSIDFKLLINGLTTTLPNYQAVVLCKKIDRGILNKIFYCFHIFKQMYHIATSKVVILDSYCITISILNHKKSLKVIQMWHAIGLMKKAGYSILNKKDGRSASLAQSLKMHKNYNYILVSSDNLKKSFKKVFNCTDKQLITLPLPRVDLLKSEEYHQNNKKLIYEKYPQMKNKKNILYVPTFRKNEKTHEEKINELIDSIDFNKFNLVIKLHPLSKINISSNKVINDKYFSSMEMISTCDYVISDYSTIIYEAAIANKPLFFYAFDIETYKKNRGFFINYEKEVPGLITDNPKKIINAINNNDFDMHKVNIFLKKYVDMNNKSNTAEIVRFIKKILY